MADLKRQIVVAANTYCGSQNGGQEESMVSLTEAAVQYLENGGSMGELSRILGADDSNQRKQ